MQCCFHWATGPSRTILAYDLGGINALCRFLHFVRILVTQRTPRTKVDCQFFLVFVHLGPPLLCNIVFSIPLCHDSFDRCDFGSFRQPFRREPCSWPFSFLRWDHSEFPRILFPFRRFGYDRGSASPSCLLVLVFSQFLRCHRGILILL